MSHDVIIVGGGPGGYVAGIRSRAVDTTVRRLRSQLERDPSQPRHFLTAFGSGYRFVPLQETLPAPTLTMGDVTIDLEPFDRLQFSIVRPK